MTKAKALKKGMRPKKENAVVRYLRETRSELRKVHWPSREEAWSLTKIVLSVTVSMAILMGLLDYLFSVELSGLISGSIISIVVAALFAVAGVVALVVLSRQPAR